ncbi:thioredoxin family protein [Alkalihalobacillus sp. AL-G]|uniref:thioredoxin family protein n=1 Tax=Alkalihalobacillus sp. AL-G TaxID=2926399 RepID=UPI00272BCE9B|nr:thioredoxin family protein [Alkalihalobacillus sp. AL-G]WLD92407.1 thioredoxin family protein [Alkalihalobacillus sp. AL-G]
MKTIKNRQEFEEAIQSDDVILMFSADWCPDCVVIKPVMPEVENNYPSFQFFYVDRDEHIELCQDMDIFGIPSFIGFQNGKEIGRLVNKDRKTQEQVENFIDSLAQSRDFS